MIRIYKQKQGDINCLNQRRSKMRVYTAIEKYVPQEDDITCFLAGGITNCWE